MQSWRLLLHLTPAAGTATRAQTLLATEGMTTHDSVKPVLSLTAIAFLTATLLALVALALG